MWGIRPSNAIRAGLVLVLGLTTACSQTGGFRATGDSPFAPAGVDRRKEAVDGLTVGHRLMASGEYELALEAFYRAAGDHGLTVDVLSAIGSANLKLGRLGQAERVLRQAIEKDDSFAPAWNNLGVVLMEKGETGEAERVFRTAFALDSGATAEIRENLLLALAKLENPAYDQGKPATFALVRRGSGEYQLQTSPGGELEQLEGRRQDAPDLGCDAGDRRRRSLDCMRETGQGPGRPQA